MPCNYKMTYSFQNDKIGFPIAHLDPAMDLGTSASPYIGNLRSLLWCICSDSLNIVSFAYRPPLYYLK